MGMGTWEYVWCTPALNFPKGTVTQTQSIDHEKSMQF